MEKVWQLVIGSTEAASILAEYIREILLRINARWTDYNNTHVQAKPMDTKSRN